MKRTIKPKAPNGTQSSLTLSDACAVEIATLIRNGEYLPGAKLSEYLLAERLGYGLSPVKMALNRLAEGGVLERRNRSGTYVRSVSVEEYMNLLEIRVRLEGLAAFQAASRISAAEIRRLEKMAQETDFWSMREINSDVAQRLKAIRKDMDFHMGIARASGNRFLTEVLDRQHLMHLCFVCSLQVTPSQTPGILAGVRHADIVEALKKRDAKSADELMQTHIGRIREFLSSGAAVEG